MLIKKVNRKYKSAPIWVVLMLIFNSFNLKAQTLVSQPLNTTTLAPGQYYNNSSIVFSTGFSVNGATGTYQFYILSDCIPMATAPSANMNYIMTSTPRVPSYSVGNSYTSCQLMQTIQYIDGLGRPIQTVQIKGSPTGNDLVQPVAYDQFGREATKYLPYAVSPSVISDGSYRANALTAGAGQAAFYTSPPTGVSPITTPQAVTAFETSPLNREVEQGAPGDAWQLTGTTVTTPNTTSGHTKKTIYTSNDGSKYWANQYSVTVDGSGNRALVFNKPYAANSLFVTVTQDENWPSKLSSDTRLNTVEEYKDKDGHIILKRTYNFNAVSNLVEILSTYYVYDDYGNLAFVLPPGSGADASGGISSANNQATLNSLCYQYNYDGRNRLITKQLPGKGVEETVYNLLDQPIFSRDANQLTRQEWAFTKYDVLSRVIMTGVEKSNTSTRVALQNYVTPQLQANLFAQWEAPVSSGGVQGYTNNCFPNSTNVVPLVVNYYDNYNFPGNPYVASASGLAADVTGQLTGKKTAVLNTDGTYGTLLFTTNYYDGLGRPVETLKEHYLGGTTGTANPSNYDDVVNTYDFSNEVTNTIRHHYTAASTTAPALTIGTSYYYDHVGRKKQTWEAITVGSNAPSTAILLSQNDYNEIGQVMTKHLHSTNNGQSFLQNTTYTYNERGWLLKINDPTIASTTTQLFAEQINYNQTQYGTPAQFNGNIAENVYNGKIGGLQHNTYAYDAVNRLLSGNNSVGFSETGITYDLMGNLLTLTRAGTGNGTLNYTTYNGNQLTAISGLKTGAYVYDGNGNMTADGPRGASIAYNMLNLPRTVTASGVNLAYLYDAAGDKLRKISGANTTDYISGIQYKTGATTIDFVQTEEGRAINAGGATYNYEYTLTDHLGNSRVTFDMLNGQVGEDDYYPFGVNVHREANATNNYLYNKKELQPELTEYDYGFRFYDPVIGRWTTVDPLREDDYFPGDMKQKRQSFGAQNSDDSQEDDNDGGDMGSPAFTAESSPVHYDMSPYNYVMNNPMRYIDLIGLDTGKVTPLKEVVITGYVKHGIAPTIGLFTWPIPKTLFGPILPGASKSTTLLSYGLSKWWTKPINWYGKRRLFTHVGENGVKRYASTWGRYFGRRLSIGLGEASTIYTILDVSYFISDYLSPKIINALPYSDQAKAPEMMGDGKTVWHPEH